MPNMKIAFIPSDESGIMIDAEREVVLGFSGTIAQLDEFMNAVIHEAETNYKNHGLVETIDSRKRHKPDSQETATESQEGSKDESGEQDTGGG